MPGPRKPAPKPPPKPARKPPKPPTAWDQFATRLQHCIDAIEDGDILILARNDANVFVQLLRDDAALEAEASSNQFILPPTHLLDQRHFARAVALGWLPPTETAHDAIGMEADAQPYKGSPNFYRQFPARSPHLAHFLIATLRQVFGVRTPRTLHYSSFKREGTIEIRWPTLGIAKYEHFKPADQPDDEAHAQTDDDF